MPGPDNPTQDALAASIFSHSTVDPNVTTGGEASAPSSALPSLLCERYTLLAEIARGGMGVVWRATDTDLGREVAIKVLHDQYTPQSSVACRFADEARITAQLQHPAIPPVHDLGMLADGRPFLAMKLIKGHTLAALLAARPNPSAERGRFVAVFEQVCQAVAYAHAHGVIHRDLKPANVMVGAFGEVQLMDWGLAKVLGERPPACGGADETSAGAQIVTLGDSDRLLTQAGSVLGTPAYMPPEQAAGLVSIVDQRSDVFGLGAVLAVILTGKPPFTAATPETARGLAALGDIADCFGRLETCGAEPELVALCKRCLGLKPADRPAEAGEVAQAVAQLRAAADERARRAELERVQAEAEKSAAEARALERRRRRRLRLGTAAALALAALSGLTAVLMVQRRANADLAAKNLELADERAQVQARFDLALKAIATFHTGVSEDVLLKNDRFKELRTRLLKEAARFYADLEKLVSGKTDAKSRQLLANGFFQLAELTEKIGSKPEALSVHRKVLGLRRELASVSGADLETRLDVARSLGQVGDLLRDTGDAAGALAAFEEQKDIAKALEAESPTSAVLSTLAVSYRAIGYLMHVTGRLAEALTALQQARAIGLRLVQANPTVTEFRSELARTHLNIGWMLHRTGKSAEALTAYQEAKALWQELAEADPGDSGTQKGLAGSYAQIGQLQEHTGKPADALSAYQKARDIFQRLVEANSAVTELQSFLAYCHQRCGDVLAEMGKLDEALAASKQALAIRQKLVDTNPAVADFQHDLAHSYNNAGALLAQLARLAEALIAYQKALAILQKLADANSTIVDYQGELARAQSDVGRLYARQRHFAEAFAALDKGLALCHKLAAAATGPLYTNELGHSYAFRGWTHAHAGHSVEAAADLRKAIELWSRDAEPSVDIRLERSRALALLAGLGADGRSGISAVEAARFADHALASLRDIIQAGWINPDELNEPDFDSLRQRADFQKLAQDVHAKAAAAHGPGPPIRPTK